MTIRFTYFVFAIILCFATHSASMAQGFLGKRWILTYQPSFVFMSAISKDRNINTQAFYEHINHHAMIEYTSNRRMSYGGELTFFSFNAAEGYQIHSYGPAFFLRYHGYRRAGAIAPVGNYNKLGLQILFNKINDFSGRPMPEDETVTVPPVSFATTWVIGKRVPISNTLLLDYGVDLSFLTLVPTYSILNQSLLARFIINFKLGIAFAAF
jgi:hypothetical protein